MKKRNILTIAVIVVAITWGILILRTCGSQTVYTLTTLDRSWDTDIHISDGWLNVVGNKREFITDRPHRVGDTIEIVHSDDNSTSKYIIKAIK